MPVQDPQQLSYENLGFDDVRQWLADEAGGEKVHQSLLALTPSFDEALLQDRFERIRILADMLETQPGFGINSYPDLHELLRLLNISGSTLQPQPLIYVADLLEQTRRIKRGFEAEGPVSSSVWQDEIQSIQTFEHLEENIRRIIGPELEVVDSASPALAGLRRKLRKSAATVRSRMGDLVKHYADKGYLNDNQAGIKGGRLVLPVLSSYKHQVQGVIQDMSNTGTTTFIEPFEIIELNNQIKTMEHEEQQEVQRILRETTGKLHPYAQALRGNYEILQSVDLHLALAKFSKNFACTIPTLSTRGEYKLISARNPRLALQRKVVPLDLHMPENIKTLIVTGPNAGGKTVALKTMGLLALMANAGIPIPAGEGSIVPLVDTIFTDIGDQQSLVNDLSTFSAHMGSIIRILERASEKSMVLLDELGTGTDPSEGGALARAVLNALAERGVMTVATTHLGDLKVYAHETPTVMNGAMEFDQKGLVPTYRFQSGIPGSSYGFEISRRLGLSEEILEQARTLLGKVRDSMETLLRSLEAERVNLAELTSENEDLKRELRTKQRKIDSALATVQKAERRADKDAAHKAGTIIAEARRTVEHVIREIRESQADQSKIKEIHQTLDRVESRLDDVVSRNESTVQREKLRPEDARVGATVTVLSLDQVGVISEAATKGRVQVDVDGKRMQVPLDWLSLAPEKHPDGRSEKPVVKVARSRSSTYSLDLRGYRADAAISELGSFIDNAVLSNMNILQIIHGKGTGVIKKIVHEVLEQHPAVKSKRLGGLDEGGAGITFVELK